MKTHLTLKRFLWLSSLAICLTMSSARAASFGRQIDCSIPAGISTGPTYQPLEGGTEFSGPKSFSLSENGAFSVLDTEGARVINYGADCRFISKYNLPPEASGALDIIVYSGKYLILSEISGRNYIAVFSSEGLLEAVRDVFGPSDLKQKGSERAPRGIVEVDGALVLFAFDGSTRRLSVRSTLSQAGSSSMSIFAEESPDRLDISANNKKIIVLVSGGDRRVVTLPADVVDVEYLGKTPQGKVVIVASMRLKGLIQVAYMIDGNGDILAGAPIPPSPAAYIEHNVRLGKSGEVYYVSAHLRSLKIGVANWMEPVEAVASARTQVVTSGSPIGESLTLEHDEKAQANSEDAICNVVRPEAIRAANAYINAVTELSDENITGKRNGANVCVGRTKPEGLTIAGTYRSVPYDWGGSSSVASYQAGVLAGAAAGDINTTRPGNLACSVGVDCSGFLTRANNMSAVHVSTRKLPSVSYAVGEVGSWASLRPGDMMNAPGRHVLMYIGGDDDAQNMRSLEATLDFGNDQVKYSTKRTKRYLIGRSYRPIRYKKMCDYVDGAMGCANREKIIFVDNMKFNFFGGKYNIRTNGYDYDGDALYFVVAGNYNRDSKLVVMDLVTYSDSARRQHVRTDRCVGRWDDRESTNLFEASCRLTLNTNAGCEVLSVKFAIDDYGINRPPHSGRIETIGSDDKRQSISR